MKNRTTKLQRSYRVIAYFQIVLLITLFSSSGIAATVNDNVEQPAGQLSKYQGKILVRQDNQSRPELINSPEAALHVGNLLRTQKDSKAFIRWFDGSKIVMKEKSQLNINAIDYFDVDSGLVIFDIANVKRPRPVRVGVKLAILGIRGTKFVVTNEKDSYNIYLKEGAITITSLSEDFKVYKKQIESQMKKFQEEFEREAKEFISDMERDYAVFKKEIEIGESEFVKEFELVESAGIAINDGVITLIPIPENIDEQFKLLDSF